MHVTQAATNRSGIEMYTRKTISRFGFISWASLGGSFAVRLGGVDQSSNIAQTESSAYLLTYLTRRNLEVTKYSAPNEILKLLIIVQLRTCYKYWPFGFGLDLELTSLVVVGCFYFLQTI